jgi:putative tricarboxylic transport membrane protein
MVRQGLGAHWALKIMTVPMAVLFPIVLVLRGGRLRARQLDVRRGVLLAFGAGLPDEAGLPLILGVILGDQIETNLVRSIMTDADPWLFVTRPISGALLGLSVASVAFSIWQHRRAERRRRDREAEPEADF